MREHHEIDLTSLQHLIDAMPGEDIVHPIVVPACIEEDLALVAVQQSEGQKSRIAASVFRIPGNAVLALRGAAVIGHVLLESGIVEPAGLAQNIDLETSEAPMSSLSFIRLLPAAKRSLHGQRQQ